MTINIGSSGSSPIVAPAPSGDTTGATDSAAIQALIDANHSGGQAGAEIRLRGGLYWGNLLLRPHITIAGSGWGTRLKAPASSASPIISTPAGSGTFHGTHVKDLVLDGNKQNGATGDCYFFASIDQSEDTSASGADVANIFGQLDPTPRVSNILCIWAGRDGIHIDTAGNQLSSGLLNENFVYGSHRHGIYVNAFDVQMTGGQVGCSGGHGVAVATNNFIATGVKSWIAGYDLLYPQEGWAGATVGAASFDGFNIAAKWWQISGCQTQDNGRAGVFVTSAGNQGKLSGHISAHDMYCGLYLQGCINVDADIGFTDGDRPGTANSQALVVLDGAATQFNRVRMNPVGNTGTVSSGGAFNLLNSASTIGNDIQYNNGDGGAWPITFASTITPRPDLGKTNLVPVNGVLTVGPTLANVSGGGQELVLIFTQDGTGHAVTWDASFKNPPAVSTTAGAVTTAKFVNTSGTGTPSWQAV